MTLLLFYGEIGSITPLPPSTIEALPGFSRSVNNDIASGTKLWDLSVTGLGQADGLFSIVSATGNVGTGQLAIVTTGNTAILSTSGAYAAADNGETSIVARWTGSGGSPVVNQTLTLTVSTRTTSTAFNPSGLGWQTLLYDSGPAPAGAMDHTSCNGSCRVKVSSSNAVGSKPRRKYDGCSNYGSGEGTDWATVVNGTIMMNRLEDQSCLIKVRNETGAAGARYLTIEMGTRFWDPQNPTAARPAFSGTVPTTKAAYQLAITTAYCVNSCWPVGISQSGPGRQTTDTAADVLDMQRNMWKRLGDGWFDHIALRPFEVFKTRMDSYGLEDWEFVCRPTWEGNIQMSPGGKKPGKAAYQGCGPISSQAVSWATTEEDAKLVADAYKWYYTEIQEVSTKFKLHWNPLRTGFFPNKTVHGQIIEKMLNKNAAGVADPFVHYFGPDVYDRSISKGPRFNTNPATTNADRWTAWAAQNTDGFSWNGWITWIKNNVQHGIKMGVGEWGVSYTPIGVAGTENKQSGADNPVYVDNLLTDFEDLEAVNAMGLEMLFMPTAAEYRLDARNATPYPNVIDGDKPQASAAMVAHYQP